LIRIEYNNIDQQADLDVSAGRIVEDDGMETSILISLFTDRIADAGDDIVSTDKRGWWGDSYPDTSGDKTGSKLWQLMQGKLTQDARKKAIKHTEDALAWMVEDKVASKVTASAEWLQDGSHKIGLKLTVEIQKPDEVAPRWKRTWELYSGV
jgi:phage gp46-like protein